MSVCGLGRDEVKTPLILFQCVFSLYCFNFVLE